MLNQNLIIVDTLVNGNIIIKIEKEILGIKLEKYTLADKNGIKSLLDLNGNPSKVQFFDTYEINDCGNIVIGIKKDNDGFFEKLEDSFDIGSCANQYYKLMESNGSHEMSESDFNYGLINYDGVLSIYPEYDYIKFVNDNACVVGLLGNNTIKYGFVDTLNGKYITPICFDRVGKFMYRKALVSYNGRYGYVDRDKVMNDPTNTKEYAENFMPSSIKTSDFITDEEGVCLTTINYLNKSLK